MAKKKVQPPSAQAVQIVPGDGDYVLEARQIARAAYDLTATEKSLLWLFIAHVQIRDNGMELLEVSAGEAVRALRLTDGGRNYDRLQAAVINLMKRVLKVETPTGWVLFHWVETARYDNVKRTLQVRLSDELTPYVLKLKGHFAIVRLTDMTRLQGKHTKRIFELVVENRGFDGLGGNRPGEWFVDLETAELRTLFEIGEKEYKNDYDFRRRVVDDSVKDINENVPGLRVIADWERFRRGRLLPKVRLNVKLVHPGAPRDVSPATPTESATARLQDQYPEEYAKHLAAVRAEPCLGSPFDLDPETEALRRLEAEIEGRKAPSRKRGRPRKNPG